MLINYFSLSSYRGTVKSYKAWMKEIVSRKSQNSLTVCNIILLVKMIDHRNIN